VRPTLDRRAAALASALLAAAALLGLGCAGDPYEPDSLPNARPTVRLFVSTAPGDTLNPTSYFARTFHWSGTDVDGFVREYYVSVETEAGVDAAWDTTAATDTTMTFVTDASGLARAVFRLACRDDRGALSDTVSQYIPLRNFPPVVQFATGYDTLRWSYGSGSFRYKAADEDGAVTMDDSVTFFLDTADPELPPVTVDDPAADASVRPVRMAMQDPATGEFEVELHGVIPPGARTLSVQVGDEAGGVATHAWSWEARPVLSSVLLVDDFPGDFDRATYYALMDSVYGPEQWSLLNVGDGLFDRRWVALETFRQFECLMWYTGSGTSQTMADLSAQIIEYLRPADPAAHDPGRMLLVSSSLLGSNPTLPPALVQNTLGVVSQAAVPLFFIPANKQVYRFYDDGDDTNDQTDVVYRSTAAVGGAVGLAAMNGAELLHRLERGNYFQNRPSQPYVAVRNPRRATQAAASTVTCSVQWQYMRADEVRAEFRRLLTEELGVVLP